MAGNGMLKLKNIKSRNMLAALEILRKHDFISRVELAEKLNCDGTTITRITRDLISKGLLKTEGMADSTGGRPREIVRLDADWANAIGIGLEPDFITGLSANLKGKILVREQVFFSGKKSEKEFTDALKVIMERLLSSCREKRLTGVGVAAFGTFSGKEQILENVVNYPALEKFNIYDFFKSGYSIAPEITDITIAGAMNEIWFNDNGRKGNCLFFNIGSGIGCVPSIDGNIVFGRHSHAGEFGHTIYHPDGDKCACGRRGCLETFSSINAIVKKLRKKTGERTLDFSDIISRYLDGNAEASGVVNEAAKCLGTAIANQVNFLMPDEILISGEILKLGDKFYNVIKKTMEEYVFPVFMKNLVIRKSEAWEEAAALGAASLTIRKVFEDYEYINEIRG